VHLAETCLKSRSWNIGMTDFLDALAFDARSTVNEGYYEKVVVKSRRVEASLKRSILEADATPVIAEVKFASPSKGAIRTDSKADSVALEMEKGGAVGISVLTEPKHFGGSLGDFSRIREVLNLPLLMKDFIVDPRQLDSASVVAANAVLLIQAVFDRDLCSVCLDEMIAKAHSNKLEVLLEVHNQDEFERATATDTDMVGINNRNLGDLKVDLNVTKNVLKDCSSKGKVVVSESGVFTSEDLRFLKRCGADGFLIGSSIMESDNVQMKVREFVNVK
jgi:indole-3-glycerol phosphate synthase